MISQDMMIYILFISLLAAVIALVTLLYSKLRREERYNYDLKKVQLDDHRKYVEDKIYSLQKQLLHSEDRWKSINHLLLDYQNNDNKITNIINSNEKVNDRLVFVLMPFNEDYYDDFRVIRNVCYNLDFKCLRGDEDKVSRNILEHITKLIKSAAMIIAFIDGRNPNVFYELGMAHALGKKTVILSKGNFDNNMPPFDLRTSNIIFYENEKDLENIMSSEMPRIMLK
ncbi:nucleoside 2-deoxyribosyltransferase [bacterium]|nr:nucleoside 2-deoxyribosyltransferase [bacterium]